MATKDSTLNKIYSKPQYRGKHIIAMDDKIYAAKTGEGSNEIFEKLTKKYPKKSLLMTYVPEKGSLIL